MSAATLQRFLVSGFDHDEWHIVVEATSRTEAIRKAEAIYFADGLGKIDWIGLCSSFIDWKAEPLKQGAQ